MKKVFTILFCMFAILAKAEVKMALLQPRVAEGSDACHPIELNMVRGELRKSFGWQSNFQVLTRTDVDQMLKELGFQQSGMVNDSQRKKVGEMTGAQYICVSTITKFKTQLYIEAYLVDVETGQMTNPATQFANVLNNDYSTLKEPCNALAKEMLGELGGSQRKSSGVVPSKAKQVPEGYVDLGLPSGTFWKSENEDCGRITYEKAFNFYGNSLPTKEQFEELKNHCFWTWTGNGYNVKGKSGKSIFLPAAGLRPVGSTDDFIGLLGSYWSSTPNGSSYAYRLFIAKETISVGYDGRFFDYSVRLVR